MKDYTKFDAELLANLAGGAKTFTTMVGKLEASAKPFCNPARPEPFRVVDRRLQALRKKNLITYSTKGGWSLVTA